MKKTMRSSRPGPSKPVMTRFKPKFYARLVDWIARQPDADMSIQEAIRRLTAVGLSASGTPPAADPDEIVL